MHKLWVAILTCLPSLFGVEQDPPLLQLSGGVFDIIHHKPLTGIAQLDYRSDFVIYKTRAVFIRPMAGFWVNFESGFYVFAGLAFDLFLGKSGFILTPSIGPGAYLRGGGKNLGCVLEFRDSIELSYRLPNSARLGAQFYHMSNASLGSRNPGTECLLLFYGFPL